MHHESGSARPGGRTARTTEAVHVAVRSLMKERGLVGLQVSEVAERAGVNATTIYRRWGSRDALVLEVAVSDLNKNRPVISTGNLRNDLIAYARQARDGVDGPDGLGFLHAIIAAAADPTIGSIGATELVRNRLEQFQVLLDHADTRTALTPVDFVDGLLAPIYLRALLSQPSTLTDADLARLVDNLLAVDRGRRGMSVLDSDFPTP